MKENTSIWNDGLPTEDGFYMFVTCSLEPYQRGEILHPRIRSGIIVDGKIDFGGLITAFEAIIGWADPPAKWFGNLLDGHRYRDEEEVASCGISFEEYKRKILGEKV